MNVDNGNLYDSKQAAIDAGEDPTDIVEVFGTREQVTKLSNAVKEQKKAQRKRQKESRKKNR